MIQKGAMCLFVPLCGGSHHPKGREGFASPDWVSRLGEVDRGGDRYSEKAIANGGNTMLYIDILNQPPREESNPVIPYPTTELEQKSPNHYHQMAVRKVHQRIRENYSLERHFLL
jgi:hypothetical protein